MPSARLFARGLLLALLGAGPAAAGPLPTLVGASAGLTNLQSPRFETGPTAGLFAEVSIWDQLSLTGALERSLHDVALSQTERRRSALDVASLGAHYRIDVARVIPYVGLVGQYRIIRVDGFQTSSDQVAALSLGAVLPLGKRFFAGAEARYGILGGGQTVGWARNYQLRAGLRFGDP